jgi:hypothetical protein
MADSAGETGMLKVLVATGRTQGVRDNDFNWCVEGELVRIGGVCGTDQQDPDGGCGCGRAFGGLNSHQATTTAMVSELPGFGVADYIEALRSSLDQQGWDSTTAEREARDLLDLVRDWPVGAIVERRLDWVTIRALKGGFHS